MIIKSEASLKREEVAYHCQSPCSLHIFSFLVISSIISRHHFLFVLHLTPHFSFSQPAWAFLPLLPYKCWGVSVFEPKNFNHLIPCIYMMLSIVMNISITYMLVSPRSIGVCIYFRAYFIHLTNTAFRVLLHARHYSKYRRYNYE